jgi:parallel beta-helix repeat protein
MKRALAGVVATAALIAALASTALADGSPTLYVNASTVATHTDSSCASAAYSTISAAVSAAASGSRIVVCRGVYAEDVTVSKPLTIVTDGATVNAAGLDNGFTIVAGGAGSAIEGFKIENAFGEGILANTTSNLRISHNLVTGNDMGTSEATTYPECVVSPQNPVPDCGEGIHLMGTSHSIVSGNTVVDNAGGILLTDETGPAHENVISRNRVANNSDDCGITLAGHNPAAAPGGVPAPTVAGIYDNLIVGNVSADNGIKGQGGGLILASPVPGGGVYDNTVRGNLFRGNGLAGVTLHSHVPGQDLNGNRVIGNVFSTNNLDGDNDFPAVDSVSTGIFVGTVGPLKIAISHNVISSNVDGIFLTGPVTVDGLASNVFHGVTTNVVGP